MFGRGIFGVACGIKFAGVRGGIWNVLINLKDINDDAYNAEMKTKCEVLLLEAIGLMDRAIGEGDQRLEAMLAK